MPRSIARGAEVVDPRREHFRADLLLDGDERRAEVGVGVEEFDAGLDLEQQEAQHRLGLRVGHGPLLSKLLSGRREPRDEAAKSRGAKK